jgi:ribosomal protein S18 acetylase RimI-like enzyme
MTPRVVIRPYRPEDRAAVYDICIRTGDKGNDARRLYRDHDLLPDVFAGPYVALEPELSFVVDNGSRAVGYVVGTADTAFFVRRYRAAWLPRLTYRYPPRGAGSPAGTPTDEMVRLMHSPERMILPDLAAYPAHLHIDLLPDYRRMGLGRALMEHFLDALALSGAPAVHLSVATENSKARAFYHRMGFEEIAVTGDQVGVTFLGRSTRREPDSGAADEPLAQ